VSRVHVTLDVNGTDYAVHVEPRKLLSDVLREDCRLTGTHTGCEHGVCGACTVLVDGRPLRACLAFAVQMEGRAIRTIEGVAQDGRLAPLQQALTERHGLQCGFCTPGIVMTFEAYLRENPSPTADEAREVLSGNLCRCTGYQNIVAAVIDAATAAVGHAPTGTVADAGASGANAAGAAFGDAAAASASGNRR
jgi:carbon-monoxide dehydrogenase small subunit